MTTLTNAQCRLCRREGQKLMLKGERCKTAKCPMATGATPPGIHGAKRVKKLSEYGQMLRVKQGLKWTYGMREKQFKLTFDKAKNLGDAGENLLRLLETRLDNTVYRFGFCKSRPAARQLVSHGMFTVNGKLVDIPSYQVKPGDIIAIKKNKQNKKTFADLADKMKDNYVPGWLNFDPMEKTGKVLHAPTVDDLDKSVKTQMIVEFYSK